MRDGLSQFVRFFYTLTVEPEEGQALLEYAWILVLVSIVSVVILGAIGLDVFGLFTRALNSITSAL